MHQMMSQQQLVVETTPGHSQKIITASETVNLIEKNLKAQTKSATGNTMTQTFTSLGFLLDMPVKLSNGIADQKQQSNLHT